MADKIGSPLEGAQVAPDENVAGEPLAGSTAPAGDDYAALVAQLKAQGDTGEIGESGRQITSENAFELQGVPGYPSLSVAAYQRQFLGARPGQIIRLQRALVAAGYLQKDQIGQMGDSFDHATRQALSWLMEDSVYGGYRPRDILNYRMQVRSGAKPGDLELATANESSPETWKQQMADEYISAWRQAPPPGYIDGFSNMNPQEFGSYERAKVTWEQSGVAEDERKELAASLAQHMNAPRQPQASQPAPGGP